MTDVWMDDDMKPWRALIKPEAMDVVSPEGDVRSRVDGFYSGKQIIFEDISVDVRTGDEIRRVLPNGNEEAFFVEDPVCYTSGHFGPHYQIKVSRRGQFPAHTGGHYRVTVSGANARVNIHSTDASTNVAGEPDLFAQLRETLARDVSDSTTQQRIGGLIDAMEMERGKPGFLKSYQAFMAGLSDHVTVFGALIPPLSALLAHAAR